MIYNNEGAQRAFRPKNKSINMALIKIKQVDGLQADLNLKMVQADLDALSVDSKDASVLAAASSSATNLSVDSKDTSILALATDADTAQSVDSKDTSILALATDADTAQSVDSKDTSILALANGDAQGYVDAESVDSKDTSILALANGNAQGYVDAESVDSKDTSILAVANGNAQGYVDAESVDSKDTSILALANSVGTNLSVDSKDTSILTAAEAYADSTASQYAIDEFGTGATALSGVPATQNLTGAGGQIGTLEVVDPALGTFVLDLSVAIEGANAVEAEQNIIGMYINGLRIEAGSMNVVSTTAVEVDLPYAIDNTDVFEIKYNKIG